jgi:hypothetical protein
MSLLPQHLGGSLPSVSSRLSGQAQQVVAIVPGRQGKLASPYVMKPVCETTVNPASRRPQLSWQWSCRIVVHHGIPPGIETDKRRVWHDSGRRLLTGAHRTLDFPRRDRDPVSFMKLLPRGAWLPIDTDQKILGAGVRDACVEQGFDVRALFDVDVVGETAAVVIQKQNVHGVPCYE